MAKIKLTADNNITMEAEGSDGVVCALGSLYMSGEVRECFPTVK